MTSRSIAIGVLLVVIVLSGVVAVCQTNEYCPANWLVARRRNMHPHTCDPLDATKRKCAAPYMCVQSSCGMAFCCADEKRIEKHRQAEEAKREAEDSDDDNEL